MSVTLTATTFDAHVEVKKSHGFLLHDDYAKTYDNNSESPITDDLELLKYALSVDDDEIKAILSFIKENEEGMRINGVWYDWYEISECFECYFL